MQILSFHSTSVFVCFVSKMQLMFNFSTLLASLYTLITYIAEDSTFISIAKYLVPYTDGEYVISTRPISGLVEFFWGIVISGHLFALLTSKIFNGCKTRPYDLEDDFTSIKSLDIYLSTSLFTLHTKTVTVIAPPPHCKG